MSDVVEGVFVGFVILSLIASVTLITTAWITAQAGGRTLALWATVIGCIVWSFVLMVSDVLLFHALIMGVLLLVWMTTDRSPKLLRWFAILAPVLPYGWAISGWSARQHELAAARTQYPVVSMTQRLSYETSRPNGTADGRPTMAMPLGASVEAALVNQERRTEPSDYETRVFRRLHTHYYDDFIASEGFGESRTHSMYSLRYLKQKRSLLEAPKPAHEVAGRSDDPTIADPPPAPSSEMLRTLHESGSLQFLDRQLFGYWQSREHVVGFEPHRMDRPPLFDYYDATKNADWTVAKLELVSLLKHSEPRVYVSTQLPRMDQLKDAPTRPLDPFESRSLEQLRTAQDLVIEQRASDVRMLGSVRAGKNCLQCHNVTRGDLLGAFSYELRRTNAVPEKKTPGGAEL